MRKILIIVGCLIMLNCYSQNVVREGNTFKTEKTVSKADTLVTKYYWQDSKGAKYPIVVNKKSGACYIWKKSSKSGKMYKEYMKAETTIQICRELNIEYKPKTK